MPKDLQGKPYRNFEQARQDLLDVKEKLQDSRLAATVSEADLERALKSLFKSIEEYSACIGNTAEETDVLKHDVAETWDYFMCDHLPVSLALLRKRFQASRTTLRYGIEVAFKSVEANSSVHQVLLLMSGYSVEQLLLCIAFHYYEGGVRRVVPFGGRKEDGTNSWGDVCDVITQTLTCVGISVTGEEHHPQALFFEEPRGVNASNPALVFKEIHDWWRKPENTKFACALDVTGGQKPMDSGASYAAMYLGWPAYYLDFGNYHPRLRRPLPHSLRYAALDLPSTTFSHESRTTIIRLVESCQFSRAKQLADDLLSFMNRSEFFNRVEVEKAEQVRSLLVRSDAWIRADYFDESLKDCSEIVCSHFQALGNADDLRTILSEKFILGDNAPEAMLAYAMQEYWRIRSVFENSGDSRDGIVATYGLFEVQLDAILAQPVYHAKISSVLTAVVYDAKNTPVVIEPTIVNQRLADARMPFHRYPLAASAQKRKLLLAGKGVFDIRIPLLPGVNSANIDSIIDSVKEAFEGSAKPEEERFLEVTCVLALDSQDRVVKGENGPLSNTKIKQLWGEYEWYNLRNLTVHWRAPLGKNLNRLVNQALSEWLPRYTGLFIKARRNDAAESFSDAECKVAGLEQIGEGECRPWHNKKHDLLHWLDLPDN